MSTSAFGLTHRVTRRRAASRSESRLADAASYWLVAAGVYALFGFLFYYSAKEKLFDQSGTMPAPLAKQFHGSLIASVPGVNTAWLLVGLAEATVVVLLAASLARGEFLPTRRKPLLLSGIGFAMFTFAVMTFAENMTAQFQTVATLFGYFVGSAVVLILVLLMPPYRRSNWLSGLAERDA